MIAITVSTNYHDLLRVTVPANLKFFKRWIFITDINDIKTIEFLAQYNVIVLYWDFKNNGRVFDKGGAIAHAQNFAYKHYPDDWYLLLDSDICLSEEFSTVDGLMTSLDQNAIYGALNRHDYQKYSDYKARQNYFDYPWGNQLQGYFQLYKKKEFYVPSSDASKCDIQFLENFPARFTIDGFICSHLGRQGNWQGRVAGADFIFDETD
ncbi:hypothetical protein SAMN05660652_02736 [Propionivibrio dicarboxylicus]|uniref:Glycosyl transferase family 2 n=2 Tax=Propionivibrio dicarboxylicus TaxID=83767 RepID=A0A1G8H9X7_9RHOO|nr:hypothetical protein SAMN05660652_02736 [Propionivibrio dicarboxylicus]